MRNLAILTAILATPLIDGAALAATNHTGDTGANAAFSNYQPVLALTNIFNPNGIYAGSSSSGLVDNATFYPIGRFANSLATTPLAATPTANTSRERLSRGRLPSSARGTAPLAPPASTCPICAARRSSGRARRTVRARPAIMASPPSPDRRARRSPSRSCRRTTTPCPAAGRRRSSAAATRSPTPNRHSR